MSHPPEVGPHLWWLVSRASGIVAVGLLSASVLLGLAMTARAIPARPGLKARLSVVHQHLSLTALVAIAVHAITLLGDAWLRPGVVGITVPFAMRYRPAFTGLGLLAAYLAALLGLSYYARRRIGSRRWRRAHRLTVVAYALAVVHTLGAGTDARAWWLEAAVLAPAAASIVLLAYRTVRVPGARRRRVAPALRSEPQLRA